jgi:RNA polymerase-binding transcription factor DksA
MATKDVPAAITSSTGTYGICRRCEEPVAQARLRARPEALHCVACAA